MDKRQRQEIEAEAARLVVLLDGNDDLKAREAILGWINADPHHAVAFAAAQSAWDEGGRVRVRVETDILTDDAPPAAEEEAQPEIGLTRRKMAVGLFGAAAAGIAGLSLGRHWGLFTDSRKTAAGQRDTALLTDGSSIAMNGDTALDIHVDRTRRQIRMLRGEALFDVAKDPKRPFVVDLGDAEIRVLGTKFNIRRKDGVTELAVTEGVVAVSSPGTAPVRVRAGASALIRPGIATTLVDDPSIVQKRVAWTEGFLEFDEQPLDEVVDEFNRYRKAPIVVGDPRIAGTLITGRFGIDESDEFAAALESSFDIKVTQGSNGALVLIRSN